MKRKVGLWSAFTSSFQIAKDMEVSWFSLFKKTISGGLKETLTLIFVAMGFKGFRLSVVDGDCDQGVYPVGQVTGLINDVPTVDELIERVISEAKETQTKLSEKI